MSAVKKEKHVSSKSTMEICSQEKVEEAVKALKLLNKKFVEEDLKKQPLLESTFESHIYLQLMLKKIPPPQLLRMIRVPLPHSLVAETSEVCLITGDLEKRNHKAEVEPTVLHYKDLLRKHGVTKVSQVIPLRQLRTEYKTFESRRQLAAAYDVFLVDKKIAGVMAKTLGKSFFQSRKFPVQIDMRRPNLKDQIDKALCQTEFSLTCRGNSYALEVARLSMEDEAVNENIKTCIEVLENKLPGNKENILSLYLKTAKSKAIPIYVSLDIPDDILIKKPRKNDKYKLDELSTIDNAEVKVFRDGRIILRKTKKESSISDDAETDKKINLNEPFSDDDLVESEEDTPESMSNEGSLKKKKKKVSKVTESTDNSEMENEEDIPDSAKASRKRKKRSKKSADLVEVMTNTVMGNEEDNQECISNAGSLKKKKKSISDVTEITNNIEMENDENIQDSANASTKRKKKSKKSADLVEVTTNNAMENEENNQDSTANKVSPKKKEKGKKYSNVDNTTDIVEIEKIQNSVTADISPKKKKKGRKSILDQFSDKTEITTHIVEIENDSLTAEISPKKKKKGRKSILDQFSDKIEIKSEEEVKYSPSSHSSSKKKNKKKSISSMNA